MKYKYRLRLVKDAELGTGLGSESINDLVPRDADGWPVLPASHVKGLMRTALKEIAELRPEWGERFNDDRWPAELLDRVFGGYDQRRHDRESAICFSDAVIPPPQTADGKPVERDDTKVIETRVVARTAIGERGIADEHTLRSTEAVPKNTEFHGVIYSDVEPNSIEGLAWRLALLSVNAVGGSRNRGGQCIVDLLKDDGTPTDDRPGELLKLLDAAIKEQRNSGRKSDHSDTLSPIKELDTKPAVLELLLIGDSPICCPERADKANVISSGFTIPASAVQGVVLTHVNRRDPDLATKLFKTPVFRCWPLNPCVHPKDAKLNQTVRQFHSANAKRIFGELPYSIRVSLSHRVARISHSVEHTSTDFFDAAFADRTEPFSWPKRPDGAPLKAADGVLLFGGRRAGNSRMLWRASEMPRKITTHGVLDGTKDHPGTHANGRNLYSVDSMAPLVWRGMISVPANVAGALVESLNSDQEVRVGKARTVRGRARIMARRMPDDSPCLNAVTDHDSTVLVLQSPALIPDHLVAELEEKQSAEDLLKKVATEWREHFELPELADDPAVWANIGIRFGWNRHADGESGQRGSFQNALPVFLPGTVLALKSKADPQKLRAAILAGFPFHPEQGDRARTRGFGALAVHPGKAVELYKASPRIRQIEETDMRQAMKIVLEIEQLLNDGKISHLPSPSQIRGVEQIISIDGSAADNQRSLVSAREYLDKQCKRIISVYYDWERIYQPVCELLTLSPVAARNSLIALSEISISHREGSR